MPSSRLSRRATLAGLAAGGAALASPALAASSASASAKKLNFLYIMADDMGYADVSCYGRRDYATPAIDALAAQGVRFTQAYANSAVCTATRVALITGRYQYRLPVGLEEPLAQRAVGLPPSQPTLPSLLRKAGYATGLIGKWHLGSLPDYDPLKSGYDEFWGIRSGAVDYYTHANSGGKPDLWDGATPVQQAGYLTDLLGDHAVAAVRRNAGLAKPWLLSLHFTAPHWPWETPDDDSESKRLAQSKDPEALMHFDGGSQKTYAAMVQRLDFQVGRILQALADSGQAENTVVVFTSDNGGERFADTWPFTGKKTELLEGGLRIPAIVRWPGLAKPGTTSAAQIISMDWLPTFVAAAGGTLDPAHAPDGIDIRAAIGGGTLPERTLYWRYTLHDQQAARRGQWKYLKIGDNTFLFDVEADPLERGNLKARHPEIFAALTQDWNRWNATMLPLDPQSYSHGFTAKTLADHFLATD
jgi:arylsulfatase A-like enzyme